MSESAMTNSLLSGFLKKIRAFSATRLAVSRTYDEIHIGSKAALLRASCADLDTYRTQFGEHSAEPAQNLATAAWGLADRLFTQSLFGSGFRIVSFDVKLTRPIEPNEAISVQAEITRKIPDGRLVEVRLSYFDREEVCTAAGTALVLPSPPAMPPFPI